MELEFKEGERVFDIRYGWGTIKEPINECFTAVIFDKDRIIECYDERTAVNLLAYEEYEIKKKPASKYQNLIGQWGIFTDYFGEFENVVVGKLKRVEEVGGYIYFVVNTCRGNERMRCFVPFTDDMIERLGLNKN